MVRTVVCTKDGCKGNEFYIETDDKHYLKAICKDCGTTYNFKSNFYDFIVLSQCSRCENNTFKIFADSENGKVYIKCNKCGAPPERIYVDNDGIQVNYQEKLLLDIKELMQRFERKISNMEIKVDSLEKGQQLLEESLAYINRYMSE